MLNDEPVFGQFLVSALVSRDVDQRLIDDMFSNQTYEQQRCSRQVYPGIRHDPPSPQPRFS